jgi:hypothetical protein
MLASPLSSDCHELLLLGHELACRSWCHCCFMMACVSCCIRHQPAFRQAQLRSLHALMLWSLWQAFRVGKTFWMPLLIHWCAELRYIVVWSIIAFVLFLLMCHLAMVGLQAGYEKTRTDKQHGSHMAVCFHAFIRSIQHVLPCQLPPCAARLAMSQKSSCHVYRSSSPRGFCQSC